MSDTKARKFRVLGTTDQVDCCDCCGKTDLKHTVEMMPLADDGSDAADEPLHFGSTCAARAAGWTVKYTGIVVRNADKARADAEAAKRAEAHAASMVKWSAWLRVHYNVSGPHELLGRVPSVKAVLDEYRAQGGAI